MTAAHDMAASRGFLRPEEVDLIQMLVDGLGGNTVVDLGAGGGTTAISVLTAPNRGQDMLVYTVDHDPANLDWARQAVANVGGLDRWFPIYGKSWNTFGVVPDLLLVDAGHEYTDVMRDLTAWLQLMYTGDGVIWFDDYLGDYPGVAHAIGNFMAIFEEIAQVGKSYAVRLLR